MPDFVRVRSKDTKAKFWIAPINITAAVEVLDEPPTTRPGLPKPHTNLRSDLPAADTSQKDGAPNEDTTKTAPSGRRSAGKSSTEETR